MNRLATLPQRPSAYLIVIVTYILYVVIFTLYHGRVGDVIASLAIIPISGASWYFGIRGGLLTSVFSVAANIILRVGSGVSYEELFTSPSTLIGSGALIITAVIVGRLTTLTRERSAALAKLEALEKNRQTHTKFLELLNEITGTALEADNLESTFNILVRQFAKLFEAQECFFTRWDDVNALTTPIVAYSSLSEVYPNIRFEPGERTLTSSIMEAERTIAIPDVENSPYISQKVASLFPSSSMLGLPLIVQGQKFGALILGYEKSRSFDDEEISRAEMAANQIALVLSKIQLLEEERKQVRQLTALHDVALISIRVDNEDQLIERVTKIIGNNLFPDNFGILLVEEGDGVLRAHPSYHFSSLEKESSADIRLGEGITGQVAKTGQPQRVGNINGSRNYLSFDSGTASELCVPIKLKEHMLGVINAESSKRDAFTIDDERLLVTLAGQLATTIEQLRTAQAERHWMDQLAHSNALIYSLAHLTANVEKALTPNEIIQVLGVELNKIRINCVVASYDTDKKAFTIDHTSMEPKVLEQIENVTRFPLITHRIPLDKWDSVLGKEDLINPLVVSDPENEIQILFTRERWENISNILHGIGITPEIEPLRLPLMFEENLLGMLWVWGEDLNRSDLPIMSIFAKQIGISLERARLFQEVQSLALTDPLTGLHNRRGLFELSRMEFLRAKRLNRPISCMMLDLDHFKQINDNYGHQIGDYVLQEVAQRCKNAVREIDLIGRYGGEELVIILPETDLPTVVQIAERTRNAIAESPISVPDQKVSVTVSIGVAIKDENTEYLETLIARADQAMYIAKHKGRDRVAVSS